MSYRPYGQMPCGCVDNQFRCPTHARQYAETKMREKGWHTAPDEKVLNTIKGHRIDVMEWYGFWAPEFAVWVCQTNLPWEVRQRFLSAAGESKELKDIICSAGRLGGPESVEEVLRDLGNQWTVEALKHMSTADER